jgi:hypothetical protein
MIALLFLVLGTAQLPSEVLRSSTSGVYKDTSAEAASFERRGESTKAEQPVYSADSDRRKRWRRGIRSPETKQECISRLRAPGVTSDLEAAMLELKCADRPEGTSRDERRSRRFEPRD